MDGGLLRTGLDGGLAGKGLSSDPVRTGPGVLQAGWGRETGPSGHIGVI